MDSVFTVVVSPGRNGGGTSQVIVNMWAGSFKFLFLPEIPPSESWPLELQALQPRRHCGESKTVRLRSWLCLTLCNPWTAAWQAPPSLELSRPDYWSGWPFSSPGDLPDPGI